MNVFSTLAPRLALAAGAALLTATLYAAVGQQQAESRATAFCAAASPGQSRDHVLGRVRALADEAAAFASARGVAVVWGKHSQYACDIRFDGDRVAVAMVTALD